jgi:hypothetical protein
MQVSAHKDAISLFERYEKSGEDPKRKDWAGKTLLTLEHHLRWRSKWTRTANKRASSLTGCVHHVRADVADRSFPDPVNPAAGLAMSGMPPITTGGDSLNQRRLRHRSSSADLTSVALED